MDFIFSIQVLFFPVIPFKCFTLVKSVGIELEKV